MSSLATVESLGRPEFWIFPIALLGACVGSFLNVVIYRLPRGLSVAQPRWSFCPNCEHRIRAYDNVPVLGWLLLAGRCRDCRQVIPPMYPVVEGLTALLFVAVWDAVFIARVVPPVIPPATLASGWPTVVSLLFLFASLMAMSVMDLETYTVDIRICNAVVVVGVAAAAILGCVNSPTRLLQIRPSDALPPVVVAAAIAAGFAWLATLPIRWLFSQRPTVAAPDEAADPASTEAAPVIETAPTTDLPSRAVDFANVMLIAAALVAVSIWMWRFSDWPAMGDIQAGAVRGVAVLFILMCALICASMVHREADQVVISEIESQRSTARAMAIRELLTFLPSLLAAVAVVVLAHRYGMLADDWSQTGLAAWAGSPWADILLFASLALASAILAAALGWTVRILGTLAFGKEAFGTGDIYILAAMGAAAGLGIAVIGFFLAAFLALAGVAILLVRKRSRAVPFGPWLALGAFLALYLRPALMESISPVLRFLWARLTGQPIDAL